MPFAGLQRRGLAAFHTSPEAGGRCFYTQPVLLKEPGLLAQPLENKSGSKEARAKVKSEADSDFPNSPNGGDVEGAGWQMGPLGVHRFVTPYKASRSNRRARSLPAPGDGSGITLAKSQHPPPCGEGGRAILVPAVPQEHPFPPHLRRAPAFLVELCTRGRRERSWPRVIYGASVKSLRQRRVRSVTSCDVWVRTAWC